MSKFIYCWEDYRKLYRLAKSRIVSRENYFAFEKEQGILLIKYLKSKKVPLSQKRLLDLGCGLGGYPIAFQEEGAQVVGVDLERGRIPGFHGKVTADALTVPFSEGSFDLVICASLIEHVSQPEVLIQEALRVLRPGGFLFLSYPPFYSPVGGHQFAPFHLLGERISTYVFRKRNKFKKLVWLNERMSMSPASYAASFGSWGLYRMTIRKTRQMMRQLPFDILDCSTRLLPINTAVIPILGEFLTWHVQFLARKI